MGWTAGHLKKTTNLSQPHRYFDEAALVVQASVGEKLP